MGRLRKLSVCEWLDLWPAFWRLAVIRISLLGGIARTRQRFGGAKTAGQGNGSSGQPLEPEITSWQRRALALCRVSRLVPGAHCLARALALRWWMRRSGLDAAVLIGVRRGAEDIESHAWVEWNGTPVDESATNVRQYRIISHEEAHPTQWSK